MNTIHQSAPDKDSPIPIVTLLAAILLLGVAYVFGLFPDIMETDAAQYASISREMAETGEYLQVKHRYADYLDKPPLLFWLSALSLKLFGLQVWAYKLPSFLFTLLGLWSLFKFTAIYYPRKVAWYASLMLASCQAWFMFNNDVRTDTILAGSVIFAIWQIARYLEYKNMWGVVFGAIGVAAAMLAKGPLGLMVPALAVGAHIIISRNLKAFLRPGWILGLVLVALMLVPMSYGLYKQYGMRGVEFFYWTQSFGRITGENEWKNDAGYFYFVHTFFWAFLPWAILAIPAIGYSVVRLIKNKIRLGNSIPETITLFGFGITFIALSLSHYKLPHYIFITFPFAAVILANFIYRVMEVWPRNLWASVPLYISWPLLPAIAGVLCCYVFTLTQPWIYTSLIAWLFIMIVLGLGRKKVLRAETFLFLAIMGSALANIQLNAFFYPTLLTYQPGKAAAEWKSSHEPETQSALYLVSDHPLEFHSSRIYPYFSSVDFYPFISENPDALIYTDKFGVEELERLGYEVEIQAEFKRQHPAMLTIQFLNPKTRESKLDYRYWVKAKGTF
ncbi:MAG: glycosyltransferase family 39 protein [Flavobacteriales bacterium]|nr:glycosyltransferase family 39 protein [Flavobacteriales bacterium]